MAAARSASSARSIGIFGGAFNPPHVGHLILAEEAKAQLDLDLLMLVPTGRAGHKLLDSDPGGELRVEMVAAAIAGCPGLAVEDYEVQSARRSGAPSYSHLTLAALSERDPEADLFLLLGADAAAGFGNWKDPVQVSERATIAVASRPGSDRTLAEQAIRGHSADGPRWVEMPQIDLSSTAIRERVGAGQPYRSMVGSAVADVIENNGLYR